MHEACEKVFGDVSCDNYYNNSGKGDSCTRKLSAKDCSIQLNEAGLNGGGAFSNVAVIDKRSRLSDIVEVD